MSAELLSSSKRLLRIDMTLPPSPNIDASRRKQRRVQGPAQLAGASGAGISAMSVDRRCACLEERGLGCR
jgi:hypothetical protein